MESNYSGALFAPHAATHEKNEDEARAPRAPARAHRPPDGVCVPRHPLLGSYLFCLVSIHSKRRVMGLILTVVGVLIANIVCYGLGQDCFHFPHAFLNLLNRQISIAENDLIPVISFAYCVNLYRVNMDSCMLQIY